MDFSEESQGREPSRANRGTGRELDEAALLELGSRFLNRDRDAFEEVFGCFREAVYVIGILELGDAEEAQDLVQETFRRAWTSAGTLSDPGRLRPWLFAIARNLCVDLAKRSRKRPTPVQEVPEWRLTEDANQAPLSSAIRREKAKRVRALLGSIPEKFQIVLALRLLEEKSYRDISMILGMPLHGVKNAVARGGRLLVEKIRNSPDLHSEGES